VADGWPQDGGRVKKLGAPIPRVALTVAEAAASLGVGPDFFDQHVRPELRLIRRGSKRLVPVAELERWADENAERTLGS
jgi:excisionase family DNA binding protein